LDKLKKIDKEYLLTDSTVNSYGYRLLTDGYLMSEYEKNPIGYYMHKNRDAGVVVKWEDFRKEGDKVFAKPVINLSHERGQRTVDEIESGFLNAASFGHFVVLEISSNPEDYLEGQTGPSVSKWFNRECSLVDIPGNYNALTDLFDENENPITLENLADLTPKSINMKQIFFTAEQLGKMNLKADADQASVETAFANLIAEAAKVPGLETARQKAVEDLKALQDKTTGDKIESLTKTALDEKKITAELAAQLKADYSTNPDGLEKVLKAIPAYQPITGQLIDGEKSDMAKMSWSELDKQGKLEDLKAKNPVLFNEKYKAEFGKEYSGK